jgi:hypothetical protein
MHVHFVQVVKFLMPVNDHWFNGNDGVYQLTRDTLFDIKSMIASLEDD